MEEVQHFAWMSAFAPFDADVHAVVPGEGGGAAVFDEAWRSLIIEGVEGQSAVARVEVVHPGSGLLAPGRNLYAHLSLTREGATHHLFAGRLVGAPDGLAGDFMTLLFDARFGDLDQAVDDAVEPLRTAPGWDPLFVDPLRLDQPMEVLEGYHAHLFVDPRTQAVRVSDALFGAAVSTSAVTPGFGAITIAIPAGLGFAAGVRVRVWWREDFREHFTGPIAGYEGTSLTVAADDFNGSVERDDWIVSLDIRAEDIAGDSVDLKVTHRPFSAVQVTVEAQWTQTAAGAFDLAEKIAEASGRPTIRTLNAEEDFADVWPVAGTRINGASGYTVQASRLVKQDTSKTAGPVLAPGLASFFFFRIATYRPELALAFDLRQKRVETATFLLPGQAQALMGDTVQVEALTFRLQDVGPVLPTPAHGTFFLTDRGRQAVAHATQRARVALAESQRCVTASAETMGWPLEVIYLTCDHTVCLHSPKLPGGFVIGKVARYAKTMDETSRRCAFDLKCSVGKGYTAAVEETDSDYVDDGYVDEGYHTGGFGVWQTGGPTPLSFQSYGDQQPADELADIGHWSVDDFVRSLAVGPQVEEQLAYLQERQFLGPKAYQDGTSPFRPEETLRNNVRTALTFDLAPLETTEDLVHAVTIAAVGAYGLPPTVDMEAP